MGCESGGADDGIMAPVVALTELPERDTAAEHQGQVARRIVGARARLAERRDGDDRRVPVEPAQGSRVLAALACVDAVAIFDGPTPERLLDTLRPNIWVKGGDYEAGELPETETVQRHGGTVIILPTVAGYSSSRLIAAATSARTLTERS